MSGRGDLLDHPGARRRRYALNEVFIGIPMPAVYVRMLTYAWGERIAARRVAGSIPDDTLEQYAFTTRAAQAPGAARCGRAVRRARR